MFYGLTSLGVGLHFVKHYQRLPIVKLRSRNILQQGKEHRYVVEISVFFHCQSVLSIFLLMAICVIFVAKLLIYIKLAKFFDCFLHQNTIFYSHYLHQNKIFQQAILHQNKIFTCPLYQKKIKKLKILRIKGFGRRKSLLL